MCPIELDEKLLKSKKWDEKRLREIFTELEFRTFIAVLNDARSNLVQGNLFDAATTPAQPAEETHSSAATVPHQYKLVQEPRELDELVNCCYNRRLFVLILRPRDCKHVMHN